VQPPKAATVLRTGKAATWKEDGNHVALTLPGEPETDLDEVVELTW
jgi:hypothetical protein